MRGVTLKIRGNSKVNPLLPRLMRPFELASFLRRSLDTSSIGRIIGGSKGLLLNFGLRGFFEDDCNQKTCLLVDTV